MVGFRVSKGAGGSMWELPSPGEVGQRGKTSLGRGRIKTAQSQHCGERLDFPSAGVVLGTCTSIHYLG